MSVEHPDVADCLAVAEADRAVLAVASSASEEEKTAEWLRGLLRPPAVGN